MDWYEKSERRYLDAILDNFEDILGGLKVIEIYVNSDLTEGRGPMRLQGRFTNPIDAYAAREGHGVQGRDRRWPYMDTEVRVVDAVPGTVPGPTREEFLDSIPPEHPFSGQANEYAEYQRLKRKFS